MCPLAGEVQQEGSRRHGTPSWERVLLRRWAACGSVVESGERASEALTPSERASLSAPEAELLSGCFILRAELGNTALSDDSKSERWRSCEMTTNAEPQEDCDHMRVLLAGPDTLYFSCDAAISDQMRARLDQEKAMAQLKATTERSVHCPEWLGARVCPQGARGGYAFLIETEDFSVKLLGERIQHRPGVYIELRSHALHTHPGGPQGACEAALGWVRETLFADQADTLLPGTISFATAKLSRADIHIDWQGGYAPSLSGASEELRCFIRPGKTKWAFHGQGLHPTGYTFGKGNIQARLYNKTRETAEKANDAYAALLAVRNGEAFDPAQDVWRLEFQLRREGAKGFKLYAPPEEEDGDEEIEAELAAEDLQHIGTLPRFFAHMHELFGYLTLHWLRLVEDNGSANRSRLPMHPTWRQVRAQFAQVAQVTTTPPLEPDRRRLVRGARYSGKSRILRRLALGVLKSLEVEDASPTSCALLALRRWVERVVEAESLRAATRCASYQERFGGVPRWVLRGMGARWERVEQVEHRVQMLLGIFAAKGVLPLELKPAFSVGDLLVQHLDDLEREVEEKGGVQKVMADHFAQVYKVALPPSIGASLAA